MTGARMHLELHRIYLRNTSSRCPTDLHSFLLESQHSTKQNQDIMLSLSKMLFHCMLFTIFQIHSASSQLLLLPSSNLTTNESLSNTYGVHCLDSLTRFGRPYPESCAEALVQMPSDGAMRAFSRDTELPFRASAADCVVEVDLLPSSGPVHSSWLYLQTAATQLMVGCLRVYHGTIRTGGAIRVGHVRSYLQLTLAKV